jgi:hypothetical protein
VRDGIYLVDFIKHEGGQAWSVSLVLDTLSQSFTAVLGRLPGRPAPSVACTTWPWPVRH